MKTKKTLIFVGILAVALLISGGLLLANLDRIVQALKPKIEAALSKSMRTSVSLGGISASALPTALKISDLQIGPAGAGISLKGASVYAKLSPLLSGRLDISSVKLDEPSFTIVVDQSGARVEGLPTTPEGQPVGLTGKEEAERSGSAGAADWLSLNLSSVRASRTNILIKDLVNSRELRLSNIDLETACRLAGTVFEASKIKLSGQLPPKTDFYVEGSGVRVELDKKIANLESLNLNILGQALSMSGRVGGPDGGVLKVSSQRGLNLDRLAPILANISPSLASFGIRGTISPDINLALRPGAQSAAGSVALSGLGASLGSISVGDLFGTLKLTGEGSKQSVLSEDIKLSVGGQPVAAKLSLDALPSTINLSSMSISLFSGRADIQAGLNKTAKSFDASISAAGLSIGQILAALKSSSVPLEGTVNRVQAKISGQTGGAALTQTLRGPLTVELRDSYLTGVNIAGDVLRAVKGLPFLSDSLLASVPSEKRAALESNRTQIKSLLLDSSLNSGSLAVKSLSAVSDIFSIDASGTIGLDGTVKLTANILFDRPFSESLAAKTKELRALFNEEGRLVVPLAIEGVSPKIKVVPDVRKLAEIGAKNVIKEKGDKLLNKLLGGKSGAGEKQRGFGGFKF